MEPDPCDPRTNLLLAALASDDFEPLRASLEPVALAQGAVLHEVNGPLGHAVFPTSACVSLVGVMRNGACTEAALVGCEGMVGVALFTGGGGMPHRAVVQAGGRGFRLPAEVLVREFARGRTFQRALLRFTRTLLTQLFQAAACNRHHSIEQQLCRWLLASSDSVRSEEIQVTQELIAMLLGVRREGITAAAVKLQAAGLIRYGRGRIRVLDRAGLRARACECYEVVRCEIDRLLRAPGVAPTGLFPRR